jgi:hypothetical protein
LMAEDQGWMAAALLVYDRTTNTVIAKRDIRSFDPRDADSVTISPLGNYFLAQYEPCEAGAIGGATRLCGLVVYDRNLSSARGLLRVVGHSDIALDSGGREVFVYQDIDTDYISMLDLATGAITRLAWIDFRSTAIGLHFSGQAYGRPGWVVVSTHDSDPASYTWMDDQVFLLELKQNGRMIRLAHTHSLVDDEQEQDYWAEPQATANRTLTKILFTSNWGRSGTEQVDTYMIEMPAVWP